MRVGIWRRQWRERKQKDADQVCVTGWEITIQTSIFITNVWSIKQKMYEPESNINTNGYIQSCCMMIITKSWLHPLILSAAIQLACHARNKQGRNKNVGQSSGWVLNIYLNDNWCTNYSCIELFPGHISPNGAMKITFFILIPNCCVILFIVLLMLTKASHLFAGHSGWTAVGTRMDYTL